MSAKDSWGHFYSESGDEEYYGQHVEIHSEFLEAVLSDNPKKLLEAGCGSGIMSVYFSKKGIISTALDRDEQVLQIAESSAQKLGGSVNFKPGDIFDLPFKDNEFDAVFSQGVLEHFEGRLVQKAVAEQLRVAPTVWISVPTKYYNHQDFGDERLMTKEDWLDILSKICVCEGKYYYFKRVKRNFLINRPLMLSIKCTRSGSI